MRSIEKYHQIASQELKAWLADFLSTPVDQQIELAGELAIARRIYAKALLTYEVAESNHLDPRTVAIAADALERAERRVLNIVKTYSAAYRNVHGDRRTGDKPEGTELTPDKLLAEILAMDSTIPMRDVTRN